ncbi:hypothetical protein EJ05DRAFT_536808 [Pseudovirgaria hyperparasitica]|uniref:Myb-like domain-containing protein n=1 Tax=Pseudovirgaria hyperparasitica TaxID=470096 RepID=A0A6A6W9F5_9PEZI|nr:uncharacterized protein EJ05DRAFT_536808 [Pseudovirgaria hyperparasitica]KAF2759508.1 hypothetical protein EJ05DRAFT_536808 [Pseudovirgaria hyperparasitica]
MLSPRSEAFNHAFNEGLPKTPLDGFFGVPPPDFPSTTPTLPPTQVPGFWLFIFPGEYHPSIPAGKGRFFPYPVEDPAVLGADDDLFPGSPLLVGGFSEEGDLESPPASPTTPTSPLLTTFAPGSCPRGAKISSDGTIHLPASEDDGGQFPIYDCTAVLAARSARLDFGIGSRSWTAAENKACVTAMIRSVNANNLRRRQGLEDAVSRDQMWERASAFLAKKSFSRSPAAVKNQWNRELRFRSNVEERESTRGGGMATSQQSRRSHPASTVSPVVTARKSLVVKLRMPKAPPARTAVLPEAPVVKRGRKRRVVESEAEEEEDADMAYVRKVHAELNNFRSQKRTRRA